MRFEKISTFTILGTLVTALTFPATADAAPTVKYVPQSATPTKQFIQLQPGMQRTSFGTKNGMNKKQFIASLELPSQKQRPHN